MAKKYGKNLWQKNAKTHGKKVWKKKNRVSKSFFENCDFKIFKISKIKKF
jgi:hypothetical protein